MSTHAQRQKGDRGIRRENDLAAKSARLHEWLGTKLNGGTDLRVSQLRGGAEGFSNETYFVDMSYAADGTPKTEALVVRWLPSKGGLFPDQDLRTQFRVMSALRDSP